MSVQGHISVAGHISLAADDPLYPRVSRPASDFDEPVTVGEDSAAGEPQRSLTAAAPLWIVEEGASESIEILTPAPRILIHLARFHIGDTLWWTPLLRALYRRFPQALITVVGPPVAAQVLAGNPHVAELLPYPEDGTEEQRREVLVKVAERSFEVALFAFARRPESLWLARRVAALGVPYRVNLEYFDPDLDYRKIAEWATHEGWFFWTVIASPEMLLHALDPFTPGAASRGLWAGPDARRVDFVVPESARSQAETVLVSHGIDGPFAVLAPGGHSSQRWPVECFGELAGRLARDLDLCVLIEGGPDEEALLRQAAQQAGSPRVMASSDSLAVLAALLEQCSFLVSNDSAPIHFAEAVGAPALYFAQREKLVHSHPAAENIWALFDGEHNDVTAISVDQAMGAIRQMCRSHRGEGCR